MLETHKPSALVRVGLALMGAVAILTTGSSVALAGPTSFPGACTSAKWDGDKTPKQAAKLFTDANQTGNKETECGNHFESDDTFDEDSLADMRFGENLYAGEIRYKHDKVTSMVLFNKANFGVCFVFYADRDYRRTAGKWWTWWVGPKQSGSAYRYLKVDMSANSPDWSVWGQGLSINDSFDSLQLRADGENFYAGGHGHSIRTKSDCLHLRDHSTMVLTSSFTWAGNG
jgi:hypothetical protein